ncbi:glycoside hydrolase family 65 protein [Paenibacillus sp. sgz500958]|uniref:glycoside hydrolase family 65 protein n=1 Tax=Paenibacillus sp. sgz500958 TaxID=3242475 RepID=UPI0036D33796
MLRYDMGTGELRNWVIGEDSFHVQNLGKYETIMSLGNGYMGIRSCTEESYPQETRNCFVAGTFNISGASEVTELPNLADVTELGIWLDGEGFHLEKGQVEEYSRTLNLQTAELNRRVLWRNGRGSTFEIVFRRFVSLHNKHVLGMRVELTPCTAAAEISIRSGINGQVTNSGAQHFAEGDKRIHDKKMLQYAAVTTESNIHVVTHCHHRFLLDDSEITAEPRLSIERRKVSTGYTFRVEAGKTLVFEKIANIHTSQDLDHGRQTPWNLCEAALDELRLESMKGYEKLLQDSAKAWQEKWAAMDIQIATEREFDQLAIRFAQYHLVIMAPEHDNRFGIAAKGLTGEGYKGHSFWDTEIFILPYFLFTSPGMALNLVEYRYHTLDGARRKAKENGYKGAMYPWESALTGDEVTPEWGPVDVVTGTPTRIWTGLIEQHITSDVAFGVWQYYLATGDQGFMDSKGYEIIMETATFWASRLTWNEVRKCFEIRDVIGPDEYKEHVDNNAFTNYMAHWNLQTAIECYEKLEHQPSEMWTQLRERLQLDKAYKEWKLKAEHIYLPHPRETDLLIPQDDTYLSKTCIDLTKYRNQQEVALILEDYNMDQLSQFQVSKQADVMILFYLLEHRFSYEVKQANWRYYEPKTLHDSSLSLATHSILASDLGETELAYRLYELAAGIDLGRNMKSSDQGIHTASIGGIWKCAVFGFGGVRALNGQLRIHPRLPKEWDSLSYPLYWQGDLLKIHITHEAVEVTKLTDLNTSLQLAVEGRDYMLNAKESLTVPLSKRGNYA